jgi:hypothetical protein
MASPQVNIFTQFPGSVWRIFSLAFSQRANVFTKPTVGAVNTRPIELCGHIINFEISKVAKKMKPFAIFFFLIFQKLKLTTFDQQFSKTTHVENPKKICERQICSKTLQTILVGIC